MSRSPGGARTPIEQPTRSTDHTSQAANVRPNRHVTGLSSSPKFLQKIRHRKTLVPARSRLLLHTSTNDVYCPSTLGGMSETLVAGGPVHDLPDDLRTALLLNPVALHAWNDITPLARNEFICWVDDAKQHATRLRRIRRTQEELEEGMRRPCCWPGCKHREHNGR